MADKIESAPKLELPASQHVVDVSIIDSTTFIRVPTGSFVENPLPGHESLECPAFVFLVQHPSGKKVLFDLGLRKDTESLAPVIHEGMAHGVIATVEKDVAQILQESGRVALHEIDSIIWSHYHADHAGDPSTFPSTVELVVGPGFKRAFLPGYPANPQGVILESDYVGRPLREIDFTNGLRIGEFQAFDFFGDGSFYLLDAPGHAIGHICALARTTPSTFILMGGDACHHCGSLRPNRHLPLPAYVSPAPFSVPPHLPGSVCPRAVLEAIHPERSRTAPYYSRLSQAPDRDVAKAEATLDKMVAFDASEDVFVVIAHDKSLLGVVDFFPRSANEWKEKGWKEAGKWRFLEDFGGAVAKSQAST
ncbi:beta-lactamase-like protein [Chaetomium strumarium]|uniref:Beta-lactamase-like protein n=1 Tax=Chaetomium strumarium TaxID=1170767 RepID=A0AAJ0LY07_9PEZI|nr:beta-lactamase-like protein [Chaetomium strumarium]